MLSYYTFLNYFSYILTFTISNANRTSLPPLKLAFLWCGRVMIWQIFWKKKYKVQFHGSLQGPYISQYEKIIAVLSLLLLCYKKYHDVVNLVTSGTNVFWNKNVAYLLEVMSLLGIPYYLIVYLGFKRIRYKESLINDNAVSVLVELEYLTRRILLGIMSWLQIYLWM